MKKIHLLWIVLFISFFGCGARYGIGGETFSSSSEALQKQTEILSLALDRITPTDNSVHGSALVLIPSDVEIQKNYIVGANASRSNKEQLEFLITSATNNFKFTANAIKKRGIFDSVSVERHNGNPASYPIGDYDFVLFFDVDGLFIKGKGNPMPSPIINDNDKSKPVDARVLSSLDSLSQQANVLRSK